MTHKSIQIAPSLLACDFTRLGEEIAQLEMAGADVLHFDVMDGHFVPNITLGMPIIESVRKCTKLPIDAHLMISDADRYIDDFARVGCNWLSVHVEACPHLHRTLSRIRQLGVKAGIAINPGTSLSSLESALGYADYVLLMSVNPGFGGQSFIPESLQRLTELKSMIKGRNIRIEIDGGVKKENLKSIVDAGAEILVMGTGLFAQKDYAAAIRSFRDMV